jgi:hypothetical protein
MGDTEIGGVYVVAATMNGRTEYWAAATPRDDAVATVLSQLPKGATASLTDRRLTPSQLYAVKLKINTARPLKVKRSFQ